MTIKFQLLLSIIIILSFSSCFKEDDKVEPHSQGDIILNGVEMGETYDNQIYFDLPSNSIVQTRHIEDWDLAFDSKDNEWYIYLNSARLMYAANTGSTDFSAPIVIDDLLWKMDNSNGDASKTAIGKWYNEIGDSIESQNYVYALNLGYNSNFQDMGKIKIQILRNGNSYEVKLAKLDGSDQSIFTIEKDGDYERVFLQYQTGQKTVAPKADEWTINFAKYSTVLDVSDGTTQDYSVVGVLLNRNSCFVARDSIINFDDITIDDAQIAEYSTAIDEIGYGWKFYNFDDGTYSIVPNQSYIIKDYKGYFYKLRFIDFYSEGGLKGSPQFEFVKL